MNILENICSGIKDNNGMRIWSDDEDILKFFQNISSFKTSKDFKNANFIIVKNVKNIKNKTDINNKHVFVLDYYLLDKIPQSFGAFFWKKGRPNIVFIKPRLKQQSLELSSELKPYIEEQVW